MKDNLNLSIIIPMYKGREFIKSTIEEALKIKHSKEVIIIDDGSPDDSYDYCRQMWNDNPQVKIISKNNGGIITARNCGLEIATGTYTIFVDQDDLVVPSTIDRAIDIADSEGIQMVFWSTQRLFENGEKILCDTVVEEHVFNREEVINKLLSEMLFNYCNTYISYIGHVWSVLYKTEALKVWGINFKKFVDIEDDYLFVFDCLIKVESVYCVKDVGYYWRYNKKSETYRMKYINNILKRYENLYSYIYLNCANVLNMEQIGDKYKTYIRQYVLIRSIENNCTCLKFSIFEWKNMFSILREPENRSSIESPEVVPLGKEEKKRKRILLLVKSKHEIVAFCYVYLDSVYRLLMKLARRQ